MEEACDLLNTLVHMAAEYMELSEVKVARGKGQLNIIICCIASVMVSLKLEY